MSAAEERKHGSQKENKRKKRVKKKQKRKTLEDRARRKRVVSNLAPTGQADFGHVENT